MQRLRFGLLITTCVAAVTLLNSHAANGQQSDGLPSYGRNYGQSMNDPSARQLSLAPPTETKLSAAEQVNLLQQQVDQLRAEVGKSDKAYPVWAQSPAGTPMPQVPQVMVSPKPPVTVIAAPAAAAAKKYPDVNVSGFFQLDAAYFGQSAESRATLGDIDDGVGFRRARLAASGNISERGSYLMEFDMAQGQPRFIDVWGQVEETPLGNMRIGRFRQPFGMTELTSVRELPFLERPTIFSLSPFRQTGIMFSNNALGDRATWAVSGFRAATDNFGNVFGDNGGYGMAERFTFLAVDNGDYGLLHFGLDHSYLDPARDQLLYASQDGVFLSQQPNLGPPGLSVLPIVNVPPFVNTDTFDVEHANLFNIETAASMGHALIQSEYRWSNLSLPTGEEATVHGGYATLRYVLTGEVIPYDRAAGVFGRITPDCPLDISQGQWGAWEIASRISTINLNPLFGLPGVSGPTRRLNSAELGLNWYWNANAKCQMEWINGSLNDPTLGDSVANTFAGRVQFDF